MDFTAHLAKADRAVLAVLGDGAVTYAPGSGAPVTVRGIFDRAYVLVDAGEAGLSSYGPAVFLRLADLPSDPEQDEGLTLTIEGMQYRPREIKPDGLGAVLIHLHEV